jgi:hypothetical protein
MEQIVKGEKLKRIRFRLTQVSATTGLPVALDLTDCTLQTKYKINGGTEKTQALTVVGAATDGEAEFQSESDGSSWDTAGIAAGRIYITSLTRVGIPPRKWQLEVVDV